MKKLSILSFIFCLFLMCCKKETIDFRDKYVGNYLFAVDYHDYFSSIDSSYSLDTSFIYKGKISESNASENGMMMQFGDTYSTYFWIFPDGTIPKYTYAGGFENENSVRITCIDEYHPTAIGVKGTRFTIIGNRIK